MTRTDALVIAMAFAVALACVPAAHAQVTQIEIVSREPAEHGQEILHVRIHGDVDPDDPSNAIIQDVQLAPRNARGRVEYIATFALAKPVDLSKASGVLVYHVVNRGNGAATASPDGHITLVSGWQGDVVPTATNHTIIVPIAKQRDGSPITGPMIARFSNIAAGTNTVAIRLSSMGSGPPIYPPATLDHPNATLTAYATETAAGVRTGSTIIPRQAWAFADCRTTAFPGTPDPTRLCLRDGFDPARLYELIYTAKDPLVLGVGLAATRDIVSFFRYASAADQNPVAGAVRHAVAIGDSQSGNLIKTFIHLGFNQDLSHRMVWDGAFPRIAARQTPINFRFALPGGAATLFEPGSEPVLWWSRYADTTRGRGAAASLLDRCSATKTCPKIIEAFGSSEFWGLRMSPGLIGTDAKADIPLPDNVRRYYYPGTTHGGGRGGFQVQTDRVSGCVLPANPNPEADTTRALTKALIAWVVDGTPPPPSRYPRLANGELVPATTTARQFPDIPGVPSASVRETLVNPALDYDFGPRFIANDLSGVMSLQPPRITQVLPTYVPTVNSDGNETVGVRSVLHQAPLGTYLGWNITASGFFAGQGCGFVGGYVPFAKTQADRVARHDPRPSLEERYGTLEGYVCSIERAARESVRERFLLLEDAARLIGEARESNVLPRDADSGTANGAIARRLCAASPTSP